MPYKSKSRSIRNLRKKRVSKKRVSNKRVSKKAKGRKLNRSKSRTRSKSRNNNLKLPEGTRNNINSSLMVLERREF